jgi:hypothetical protein
MQSYRIAFWLSLIGGVFILLLGYIMDYFESSSSSITFSRSSYGEGSLTPYGAKMIGLIILFICFLYFLSNKGLVKTKAQLNEKKYKYIYIKKKKKRKKKMRK